jgi:hypothetical protein
MMREIAINPPPPTSLLQTAPGFGDLRVYSSRLSSLPLEEA